MLLVLSVTRGRAQFNAGYPHVEQNGILFRFDHDLGFENQFAC